MNKEPFGSVRSAKLKPMNKYLWKTTDATST